MAAKGSQALISRTVRTLSLQLGEIVHVAAVYLGIAALVTIVLGLTVPSLRDQSRQMHEALLASLRPVALREADGPYAYDLGGLSELYSSSVGNAVPAAPGPEQAPGEGRSPPAAAAGEREESRAASARRSFAQELRHGDMLAIPGASRAQAHALRGYIARKYRIAGNVAGVLVHTAFSVGRELGLDPQLLLAVIAVESRYNPFAESHVGAQGLMQVMTDVHKDKFARYGEVADAAINPIANIRVGAQILADCIKRRGSVEGGLACYVGATGPSDGGYGARVLAERRRIALASGIPPG